MRTIYLLILILLSAEMGYSQSGDSMYNSIQEEHGCSDGMVYTDSVYSFLRAAHFEEIESGHIFILKSKPFPIHELRAVAGFRPLTDTMPVVLDSATTHTQPITVWDISRLPKEGWLLYDDKNPIYDLIVATPWSEERGYYKSGFIKRKRKYGGENKKRRQAFKEGVEFTQKSNLERTLDISMSAPVFDKNYEYALLFMKNNSVPDLEKAFTFYLYKRDTEKGWRVYSSGNIR